MTGDESQNLMKPEVIHRYQNWLIAEVQKESFFDRSNPPSIEATKNYLEALHIRSKAQLQEDIKEKIFLNVINQVYFGKSKFGPLQELLTDPTITEIMINGSKQVYIERRGALELTSVTFTDDDEILKLIDQIIKPLGRSIDSFHPTADARLPDGSRVNAVIPPVAIDGPGLTIRRFAKEKLKIEDLIGSGSISSPMAQFLEACVMARLNILVSGGTGSGKTTLLNILSSFIPEGERIVTIEDAAELQLHQRHVFRLEARTPDSEGRGEVTIRHLVRNALRMRPDRIIVGEVRGSEALDMLQAMNTGHDGSITTLHANSPRDATSRLETLVLMSGLNLPLRIVREQIASAVDLIVQQSRFRDGSRKVTSITELIGMEGDIIVLNEIFKFSEIGMDNQDKVIGELVSTGMRPMFINRLERAGIKLPPEVFGADLKQFSSPKRQGDRK